jgi:hypothetical protein
VSRDASEITLRGVRRTAFERNLLPGFSAWVVEQIERWKPDYLIPAETKGARILDAALDYAREEMGRRIAVPILYTGALPYIPAQKLRRSRVMVVDDAVRSGGSIDRHRDEIESYGVREIKPIACVGCLPEEGSDRPEVESYLWAESSLYERYVWQLTELVVARGLPPEVDHFLFQLRLPGPFQRSWPRLAGALAPFGTLTVDGPDSRRETPQPVTLHFPHFPGTRSDGPEVGAGANKLRFFPDADRARSFAVPICFPALTLEHAERQTSLPADRARAAITAEMDTVPEFAALLLEHASSLRPKTIFRIVSACKEVEMIHGLASLLGPNFPASSLRAQAEGFDRLYGPRLGPLIAAVVAVEIDAALEAPAAPEALPALVVAEDELFLDPDVEEATDKLARRLKDLYDNEEANNAREPWMAVGRSMPELAAEVRGSDPLLASRCVDFGLALTTLVPFIAEVNLKGGGLKIERHYRVSENNRGDHPYSNLDIERRKKSEEALAVICKRLHDSSRHFQAGVPLEKVAPIVGVLRPLVLEAQSLTLKAVPSLGPESGLRLLLTDTVTGVAVGTEPSSYVLVDDAGLVVPTPNFFDEYEAKGLILDLDGCTEEIEDEVDRIVKLIEPLDEQGMEQVLDGWARCVDQRLGLTHVHHLLAGAMGKMRAALRSVRAGTDHSAEPGVGSEVRAAVDLAGEDLRRLERDWSGPARKAWEQQRGRGPERLLDSLFAPKEGGGMYAFAAALGEIVAAVGRHVELLSVASGKFWADEPAYVGMAARKASECAGEVTNVLWSLSGDAVKPAPPPVDDREALRAAAGELLDLVELLDAFSAALAGVYRGHQGRRPDPADAGVSRQVSVLSLDLAGSTANGELLDAGSNYRWVEGGLNLAAQWTRAFGGAELSDRKGDELTIEFPPSGDAGVLSAAFVLRHTAALRSTEAAAVRWTFHAGVDCGQVDDGDGSNVIGSCINRAAKLAKEAEPETRILIGEAHAEQCSSELRDPPVGEAAVERTIEGRRVLSRAIDAERAVAALTERVRIAASTLAASVPALPAAVEARAAEPASGLEAGAGSAS